MTQADSSKGPQTLQRSEDLSEPLNLPGSQCSVTQVEGVDRSSWRTSILAMWAVTCARQDQEREQGVVKRAKSVKSQD